MSDPDDVVAWLKAQIGRFTEERPIYERYADFLQEQLTRICREVAPSARVESRAKSVSSFAGKALRKRDRYADPVRQFTDLCGARVITTTQNDVDRVSRAIRARFLVDTVHSGNKTELMGASQFGYASVHFVVEPSAELPAAALDQLRARKAEIQVRTILQHAWATLAHDRLYKSPFPVPTSVTREMNRAAALLEEVDRDFSLVLEGLERFAGQLTPLEAAHVAEECQRLQMLIDVVPDRAEKRELALRLAAFAASRSEWSVVIGALTPYASDEVPAVWRELGIALCRQSLSPSDAEVADGLQHLMNAVEKNPDDAAAHAALASCVEDGDAARARRHYARAYELQPQPVLSGRLP